VQYGCAALLVHSVFRLTQAVSVAQLQGHLMLHRHDPIKAVLSADFRRQEVS